jgi:hypothetical protein
VIAFLLTLSVAGFAAILYWILDPRAPDPYLYVGSLAPVAGVAFAAVVTLVLSIRERHR